MTAPRSPTPRRSSLRLGRARRGRGRAGAAPRLPLEVHAGAHLGARRVERPRHLGASLRARVAGARQLARHASRFSEGTAADRAAWRARLADLIGSSEVSSVLAPLIEAAVTLKAETAGDNAAPLAALAQVLRSKATWNAQAQAVCAAAALTADDADAFLAFADSLAGAPLAPDASALLTDPTDCDR